MKKTNIGVVGPCAAGKSTLIKGLQAHGINASHIAQEHSYVKDMWKRISNPDVLIFLDVSYSISMNRRKLNWTPEEFQNQVNKLTHAYQHADLYLQTDQLTPQEVLHKVLTFLHQINN